MSRWNEVIQSDAFKALSRDKPMTAPNPTSGAVLDAESAAAWLELSERDDRTSPEDYPEMCLIEREELVEFMARAYRLARPTPEGSKNDYAPTETITPAQPELEVVAWLLESMTGEPAVTAKPSRARDHQDAGRNPEPLVRLTQAQAKIARLEEEVAERDARIEGLEADLYVVASQANRLNSAKNDAEAPLMREPFAAITSLDGTVKEPLICLTIPERDAILAALRPAGVGEAVAWLVERTDGQGYGPARRVIDAQKHDPSSADFWVSEDAQRRHHVQPLYTTPAQPGDALMERVRTVLENYPVCGCPCCAVAETIIGNALSDLKAGAGR